MKRRGIARVALAFAVTFAVPAIASARTAYVTYQTAGAVAPVNLATGAVGSPISIGGFPQAIAIAPDGRTAYVGNSSGIVPVDTATNTAGTAIPIPAADAVAITPDGATAYAVSSQLAGKVTPIDLATRTAGTPIAVGRFPTSIAITPDGSTAYVTNVGSESVTPIDLATNTAKTPIPVSGGPSGVAITPDGRTAYVTQQSGSVTPIDVATNAAGPAITTAGNVYWIAITPDGRTAYAASTDGPVTPIDIATNQARPAIPMLGVHDGIAAAPDSASVYVAYFRSSPRADQIVRIDTASDAVGQPVDLLSGGDPTYVAITPDQGPTASFAVSAAAAGSPTAFDASASTDPDGHVARYLWDFGDGQTQTTTVPTTTHVYAAAGAHTATLTVVDDEGCSATFSYTGQTASCVGSTAARTSRAVTVAAAPPTVPPKVSPANRFTLGRVKVSRTGVVSFRIVLPGPGGVTVRETATMRGAHRFTFARRTLHRARAGAVTVRVKPTARGRRAVRRARRALRIDLAVTFRPTGGIAFARHRRHLRLPGTGGR